MYTLMYMVMISPVARFRVTSPPGPLCPTRGHDATTDILLAYGVPSHDHPNTRDKWGMAQRKALWKAVRDGRGRAPPRELPAGLRARQEGETRQS